MARFKDQAIVIRELDWSETSQIVTLLTEAHGKIKGLAKGSRRTSPGAVAKYSGGIDLLTLGQVLGVTRPGSDLATLTEWDLQQPWPHLRHHLAAQQLAFYAADLANALLPEGDPHPATFHAFARFIDHLRQPPRHAPALLLLQWQLLADAGYAPQFHHDAHTGQTLPDQPNYLFDPRLGGLRADGHLAGDESSAGPWRVRRETVAILQQLAPLDLAAPAPLPAADAQAIARANRLLCVYVRAIIDRELPTMSLILR